MGPKLRILMVEDAAADAELLVRELRRTQLEFESRVVAKEAELTAALREGWDLILSDYTLPNFDALAVLRAVRANGQEVPVIIVSGSIGDEAAAACFREGAADYLLKDRLARLGAAVRRALEERRRQEERRRTEARLRASERSLSLAQRVAHLGSWELDLTNQEDLNANTLRWSDELFRLFGYEPGEVAVTNELFFRHVHPDDRPKVVAAMAETLRTGRAYCVEHRIVRADGVERQLLERGDLMCEPGTGRRLVILGAAQDVTEQVRAEQALRESEERYRRMVDEAPDAIFALGPDRVITALNPAFETITGHAREEWLGRDFAPLIEPADLPAAQEIFEQGMAGEKPPPFELRMRRRSGETVHVEFVIVPQWKDGQVAGVTGMGRNVTARKQAESALRESEERFRELAENIREVFWLTDTGKSRMLYVSPGYEEIWGRTCASLYDSPLSWVETIHPADRARVLAAAEAQANGGYDESYRIVRPDGAVRWVRDQAFPIRDERGAVRRIAGVAEDITERKRLEEQFLQAQRMEAIGILSSGIAHDLNNILAPITMAAGVLRRALGEGRNEHLLGLIESSAQRGANIIRQLLTFSRGVAGERVAVQLRHLIREMAEIARETFPRSIEVAVQVPRDLPAVLADATQLHQVLMNLCLNARDAMPRGGRLSLRAEVMTVDGELRRKHPEARPGPHVLLAVADTGEGMSAAILARIFEPFFTTKEVGKGTGLGLPTVLGIVRSHNGFVSVESEPGRGTVFTVFLPVESEQSTPAKPRELAVPNGNRELILFVDDEPTIRHAMASVLESHGYRVLIASNGREALDLYLRERDGIKVLLTDMMMPVMGGAALIRALRALEPELRIVVATGLIDDTARAELDALRVTEVLPKPCAPQELLAALHRQLSGGD